MRNSRDFVLDSHTYYVYNIFLNSKFEIKSFGLGRCYNSDTGTTKNSLTITIDLLKTLCSMQESRSIQFLNMFIEKGSDLDDDGKDEYHLRFIKNDIKEFNEILVKMEDREHIHPFVEKHNADKIQLTKLWYRQRILTDYHKSGYGMCILDLPISKAEIVISKDNKQKKMIMSAKDLIQQIYLVDESGCKGKVIRNSGLDQLFMFDGVLVTNYDTCSNHAKAVNAKIESFPAKFPGVEFIEDTESREAVENWINKLRILGYEVEATDGYISKIAGDLNTKELTIPDVLGFIHEGVEIEGTTLNITSKNTIVTKAHDKINANTKIKFRTPDLNYIDNEEFINRLAKGNEVMSKIVEAYVYNKLTSSSYHTFVIDSCEGFVEV